MDPNDQGVEIDAELPEVADGEPDTTDWKAKALEMQGKLKEARGISKRYQKDLEQSRNTPKAEPKADAPQAKQGFDYGQKAYLKSSGIDADDFEFVKEVMDNTGKDLDSVLASKYFQSELKERKDLRMAEQATPSGSKRAGNTTRDQVEYWMAKGELPPDRELRQKVVNARMKAEQDKSQFTEQPVAGISFK